MAASVIQPSWEYAYLEFSSEINNSVGYIMDTFLYYKLTDMFVTLWNTEMSQFHDSFKFVLGIFGKVDLHNFVELG